MKGCIRSNRETAEAVIAAWTSKALPFVLAVFLLCALGCQAQRPSDNVRGALAVFLKQEDEKLRTGRQYAAQGDEVVFGEWGWVWCETERMFCGGDYFETGQTHRTVGTIEARLSKQEMLEWCKWLLDEKYMRRLESELGLAFFDEFGLWDLASAQVGDFCWNQQNRRALGRDILRLVLSLPDSGSITFDRDDFRMVLGEVLEYMVVFPDGIPFKRYRAWSEEHEGQLSWDESAGAYLLR